VLIIPPEFSRRQLEKAAPRLALIEDNTDNFVATTLAASMDGMIAALNRPPADTHRMPTESTPGHRRGVPLRTVHPILAARFYRDVHFMMVMIGGGIIFIDDKARGLHEGYLVTPITKLELIAGFNLSGTIKAVLAGIVLMTVWALIAGIPNPFAPLRLMKVMMVIVVTAFALISLMFLLMVRVTDPLVPRAMFGLLNTMLYFPSGAVYPRQGLPRLDAGDFSGPTPSPTRSMRSSACC